MWPEHQPVQDLYLFKEVVVDIVCMDTRHGSTELLASVQVSLFAVAWLASNILWWSRWFFPFIQISYFIRNVRCIADILCCSACAHIINMFTLSYSGKQRHWRTKHWIFWATHGPSCRRTCSATISLDLLLASWRAQFVYWTKRQPWCSLRSSGSLSVAVCNSEALWCLLHVQRMSQVWRRPSRPLFWTVAWNLEPVMWW